MYLTRRGKPVAALVDLVYLDSLLQGQLEVTASMQDAERQRRLDEWIAHAAQFSTWVKPGVTHPSSASDVYATRKVEL